MTENELKRLVLRDAYAQGWAVYHVTQQAHHNAGGTGYPDLTLARDGQVQWMELKQESAHLSAAQIPWMTLYLPAHSTYIVRPSTYESGRVAELLS